MGKVAAVESELFTGEHSAAPYPPSWADRLTDWIERLTGSGWVFYLGLGLMLYLFELATQWTGDPGTSFYLFHLVYVVTVPLDLALIRHLDAVAAAAFDKFQPVLDCSEAERAELRYRLTTLPARSALIATLLGTVTAALFLIALPLSWRLQSMHFADSPASIYYNSALAFVVYGGVGVLAYHTLHQLMIVRRIYRRARVNLFNIRALYAFSNLSARTAIVWLGASYAWIASAPELLNQLLVVLAMLYLAIMAIITFIWPLLGVHSLLVDEKNRLLGETAQHLEATIAELHRRVSGGEIQGMDDLNKAMASLEIEQMALSRISTWPWQAETLRWFVAALLFPMAVWFMQWLLQRVLEP